MINWRTFLVSCTLAEVVYLALLTIAWYASLLLPNVFPNFLLDVRHFARILFSPSLLLMSMLLSVFTRGITFVFYDLLQNVRKYRDNVLYNILEITKSEVMLEWI